MFRVALGRGEIKLRDIFNSIYIVPLVSLFFIAAVPVLFECTVYKINDKAINLRYIYTEYFMLLRK